jgi:hypothetical protein
MIFDPLSGHEDWRWPRSPGIVGGSIVLAALIVAGVLLNRARKTRLAPTSPVYVFACTCIRPRMSSGMNEKESVDNNRFSGG